MVAMTERFTRCDEWADDKGNIFKWVILENGKFFMRCNHWSQCKKMCDKLNAQHNRIKYLEKRNQTIINTIKTSMENERTHIGYNVLKQLLEAIQ